MLIKKIFQDTIVLSYVLVDNIITVTKWSMFILITKCLYLTILMHVLLVYRNSYYPGGTDILACIQ